MGACSSNVWCCIFRNVHQHGEGIEIRIWALSVMGDTHTTHMDRVQNVHKWKQWFSCISNYLFKSEGVALTHICQPLLLHSFTQTSQFCNRPIVITSIFHILLKPVLIENTDATHFCTHQAIQTQLRFPRNLACFLFVMHSSKIAKS